MIQDSATITSLGEGAEEVVGIENERKYVMCIGRHPEHSLVSAENEEACDVSCPNE